jgi:hypothetical protein
MNDIDTIVLPDMLMLVKIHEARFLGLIHVERGSQIAADVRHSLRSLPPSCRNLHRHSQLSTPAWSSRAALSMPLCPMPPPLLLPLHSSHFHDRPLVPRQSQVRSQAYM